MKGDRTVVECNRVIADTGGRWRTLTDTGGRGGGVAASGARGAEAACARRSQSQVDLGAAAATPGVGEGWFVKDELGAPCGAPNAERGAPVLAIRHVDGILPGAAVAAGVAEPRVRSFRVPEGGRRHGRVTLGRSQACGHAVVVAGDGGAGEGVGTSVDGVDDQLLPPSSPPGKGTAMIGTEEPLARA